MKRLSAIMVVARFSVAAAMVAVVVVGWDRHEPVRQVAAAQQTAWAGESSSAEENLPAREALRSGTPAAEMPAVEVLKTLGARVAYNEKGLVYRLQATRVKIGAREAQCLADLSALESLQIGETLLDEAARKHISGLAGLRRLYLRNVGLTDAALENLSGLAQLEVLSLAGNRIRGSGLVHLRGLIRLEVLNLSGNPLSDDGLAFLAAFPDLNTLTLADTRVTGAGLVHLKPLAKLRVLNLDRTKVVDRDLVHLVGLQNMRMLYLRGCKVTEKAVSKLDDAISGLSIYY